MDQGAESAEEGPRVGTLTDKGFPEGCSQKREVRDVFLIIHEPPKPSREVFGWLLKEAIKRPG